MFKYSYEPGTEKIDIDIVENIIDSNDSIIKQDKDTGALYMYSESSTDIHDFCLHLWDYFEGKYQTVNSVLIDIDAQRRKFKEFWEQIQ